MTLRVGYGTKGNRCVPLKYKATLRSWPRPPPAKIEVAPPPTPHKEELEEEQRLHRRRELWGGGGELGEAEGAAQVPGVEPVMLRVSLSSGF